MCNVRSCNASHCSNVFGTFLLSLGVSKSVRCRVFTRYKPNRTSLNRCESRALHQPHMFHKRIPIPDMVKAFSSRSEHVVIDCKCLQLTVSILLIELTCMPDNFTRTSYVMVALTSRLSCCAWRVHVVVHLCSTFDYQILKPYMQSICSKFLYWSLYIKPENIMREGFGSFCICDFLCCFVHVYLNGTH